MRGCVVRVADVHGGDQTADEYLLVRDWKEATDFHPPARLGPGIGQIAGVGTPTIPSVTWSSSVDDRDPAKNGVSGRRDYHWSADGWR